ncbi:MAG: di-trans,poly-cis-decaprenylcistransferase [Lachnospiraceae bacterium]|nr:di-trans,poly-cis-decaprenylcistransferase [Lachnospiraceae bacterium]
MAEEKNKVPLHLAMILDGNGRWAKKRHMPRNYGHSRGSRNVEKVCELVWDHGIKYFTVYAFSTENWKRPESEVNALMDLFRDYLEECRQKCTKNNMKVRIIGDRSRLRPDLIERIDALEETSKDNTGLNFQIAVNYGGRDDLVRAFRAMVRDMEAGTLDPGEVTEETLSGYTDTGSRDIPDPDLLIRTGGDFRISNFLLWQIAYTEIYITDVLWPDFGDEELTRILDIYGGRERRFGGIKQ